MFYDNTLMSVAVLVVLIGLLLFVWDETKYYE